MKHTRWCEDQEYCKNCEYGCEVVARSSDVTASSVSCDLEREMCCRMYDVMFRRLDVELKVWVQN